VTITGGDISVTDINTISSTSGVVTATANTGVAGTLTGLSTDDNDDITVNMAAADTSASDLKTIDSKQE
ncbi:hypothetical protein, partial [Arcobacter peruensis]|uniref:hypothetical protein n=1 Tax=Arcobacter peruensis TaxID=2320140 RepID=UPI0013DF0C9D